MSLDLQQLLSQIGKESMAFYVENRLTRLKELAKDAHLLEWTIPIISVTGTNGKGSTVSALKEIYQASGYKVGIFTSPHLIKFNERIAINNCFINDEDFIDAIRFVIQLDKHNELSFFEKMLLVALYYFKQQKLDALILEVGCGGRLDAINILDADLVILSSIDLDHQAFLGDSIEAIGAEKAGLFRKNKLAIFADVGCPITVIEMAKMLQVDLKCLQKDYQIIQKDNEWTFQYKNLCLSALKKPKIHIHAMGSAILATTLLQEKLLVSEENIRSAVEQVSIPGRLQWIQDDTTPILLDVSHNPHAAQLLVERLQNNSIKGQIHVVFGAMKDKDCKSIIQIVNKLSPVWYTTYLKSNRSHDLTSMNALFETQQYQHQFYPEIKAAFNAARKKAKNEDYIVVFGSFVLVGEVMSLLQQEGKYVF